MRKDFRILAGVLLLVLLVSVVPAAIFPYNAKATATQDGEEVQKNAVARFFERIFGGGTEEEVSDGGQGETAIISEGIVSTVAGRAVSIVFISSTTVKFNVDGVLTNSLSEGNTQSMFGGTYYLTLLDIFFDSRDGGVSSAQISVIASWGNQTGNGNTLNATGLFVNNAWIGMGRYNVPLIYVSADANRVDFNGPAPKFWNGLSVHNTIKAVDGVEFGGDWDNPTSRAFIGRISDGVLGSDYVFLFRNENTDSNQTPYFVFDFGELGRGEIPLMIITKGDLEELSDVPLTVAGNGVSFGDKVLFGENARFAELTGSGNAYACLSSQGLLFRSSVPCTQAINTTTKTAVQ